MNRTFMVLVLLALAGPAIPAGPGVDALSSRIDARTYRLESRVAGREIKSLDRAAAEAAPPIAWDMSIGIAYTDAQDGSKSTSSPFLLKAKFNEGKTSIKLTGDGFARVKTSDGSSSGLSDVTVTLAHLLGSHKTIDGTAKLVGEIGYTIPSHSDVGSTKGRERIGLAFSLPFSQAWAGRASARLIRFEEDPPAGVSRVSRSGIVQTTYTFLDAPGTDIVIQLERSYRPGAGGTSQATVTYDFPMTYKGFIGSIGFTRGLTSGARDNSLEFDISLSF